MRKIPPHEEPAEKNKTHHSERYSIPQQRYRTIHSRQLPSKIFHSDEHPEIPRIKRASRYSRVPDELPTAPPKHRRSVYNGTDKSPAENQPAKRNKQHSLLAPLQLLTSRQKLIVIGSALLAIALLMSITIINTHQLSSQNRKIQASSQSNHIVFRNTTAGDSPQIAAIPSENDHPAPPVLATSAYLLDADSGATLYESKPLMHLPMLSTTKLMTALVAVQIGDLNQNVLINDTITNDINQLSADSSLMGIKRGETYTLKDLLYGMLLVSGNDAAVAIADQLGGGNQQKFIDRMNQEAAKLKLHDTHYMNPHGLPATGHFSSAHDLALLAKSSLSMPFIHTISSTRKYDIPKDNKHESHNMLNGNQFLWWYPGVDGGKPGWDTGTNFVQVISCIRNQRHLIGVLMHTVDWWTDMRNLMNWGFNTFTWISPREVNSPSNPVPFAAGWNYFQKDRKENTIPTADRGRYYIYTGYSIAGLIMDYFDKNGGLKTFGYPTSQPKVLSDKGLSQRFERSTIRCDPKTKLCKQA